MKNKMIFLQCNVFAVQTCDLIFYLWLWWCVDVIGRPFPTLAQMFPDFIQLVKFFERFKCVLTAIIVTGCADCGFWLYKTVWHEFTMAFCFVNCVVFCLGQFYTATSISQGLFLLPYLELVGHLSSFNGIFPPQAWLQTCDILIWTSSTLVYQCVFSFLSYTMCCWGWLVTYLSMNVADELLFLAASHQWHNHCGNLLCGFVFPRSSDLKWPCFLPGLVSQLFHSVSVLLSI